MDIIDNIKILLKDYSTVLLKDFDYGTMKPIGVNVYDDIYIALQDTFPNFCREVTWYDAINFIKNIGKGVYLPSWSDISIYQNSGKVINAVILLLDGYALDDGQKYWTSDDYNRNKEDEKAACLHYSSSGIIIDGRDKNETARVRTFININPKEEEEEVNTPNDKKKDIIWHTLVDDKPTINCADCLVLVGGDENNNDRYEVLMWDNDVEAFNWGEYKGKTIYFPADNFTKWAYIKDLVRLKTTEPMSPDMVEEISNRRYELYQKPMDKMPECANKEVKVPYCTSHPLLNGKE